MHSRDVSRDDRFFLTTRRSRPPFPNIPNLSPTTPFIKINGTNNCTKNVCKNRKLFCNEFQKLFLESLVQPCAERKKKVLKFDLNLEIQVEISFFKIHFELSVLRCRLTVLSNERCRSCTRSSFRLISTGWLVDWLRN